MAMAVPTVLATVAACGSIVTSIKSSWELKRMVKKKKEERELEEEAPYIFRKMRKAYYDGLMSTAEYEHWYERFLVAKVEKDMSAMRRIRAHLRIVENGAPVTPQERSRTYEPRRRRHSLSYASPQYVDRPHEHGNLDYYPDRRPRVGAPRDQFIPLEPPTYARSPSSDASSSSSRSRVSRSSSVRYESRGRSRRRYDSSDSDDESDDYYEKKHYRGRSSQRY
ncbi:hypothetical protein N656DRAFT_794913 [Canariomyces notabilis]|uniref:Uncharacterized protein n=1 Tax=Canariomyces notabilis TaxID=2074819 RepID=A0AAN6YWS2_9PEZI|nr:hypothetical protein N656DRAFT_794913 [Canariomyces arenarius]